jgi:uncharacterized protein YhfF
MENLDSRAEGEGTLSLSFWRGRTKREGFRTKEETIDWD